MDVSFFTEGKRSTNGPYVDLVSMVSKFLWNSVSPTFLHPLAHMEKKEYFNHLFLPLGYYLRRTSANRGTALGDAAFVLGAWTLGRAAVAGWILFTGVLAGHYNSDTWRQGEEAPKLDDIKDFGLFQIETTGDRTEFYSVRLSCLARLPITGTDPVSDYTGQQQPAETPRHPHNVWGPHAAPSVPGRGPRVSLVSLPGLGRDL
jgi:hypothetical protein